jgi:hypothetical protein
MRSARTKLAIFAGVSLLSFAALACSPQPASQPQSTPPTPAPVTSTGAIWQQLQPYSDLPSPRINHTIVLDNARGVWLFGGRTGGKGLNDLWRYDLASNAWRKLQPQGSLPPARWGHQAVFNQARDQLVVLSGQSAGGFFNDVWIYDIAANTWSEAKPPSALPEARYGAGLAYDEASNVVYLIHGFTNSGRFDDTWAFDLNTGAWRNVSASAARPLRRCLLDTVYDAARQRVLLFGGQSNEKPFLGDLWSYNVKAAAWQELSNVMPAPRHLMSLALDAKRGRALLFGGRTEQGAVADVWALDLASTAWRQVSIQGGPSARHSHDAVYDPVGDQMLVFGGSDGAEQNDMWALRARSP